MFFTLKTLLMPSKLFETDIIYDYLYLGNYLLISILTRHVNFFKKKKRMILNFC